MTNHFKLTSTIAAMTLGVFTMSASADIGFAAAVDLSRTAVADATLFSVELRERNNMLVYEGDMYTPALTVNWNPRFNPETGALIVIDINGVDQSNVSNLTQIFAMLPSAQLDFAAALDIATAAHTGSGVQKIGLDIEAGILAYQVEFFDLSKVYVDSVTGGVIPHHQNGDDMEDTLPAAAFQTAIGAATTFVGEGWTAWEADAEDESGSNSSNVDRVEVTFFNADASQLQQVDVDLAGVVISSQTFSPGASQAARIAAILPLLGGMTVGMSSAVASAEAAHPGSGIHEVELKLENGDLTWKVQLITTLLVEIDFWVDATTQTFASTAPVNYLQGDLNRDGIINGVDLVELFAMWGSANPDYDFDSSGSIGGGDLPAILSGWAN